jgi:hypothetical protein
MLRIPRPVIGAAAGAVIGTVSVFFIIKYHPVMRLPDDVKDTLSTIWTGLLSIAGGMVEHWRIERQAKKIAEEDDGTHKHSSGES